jgi:hypothetical protein
LIVVAGIDDDIAAGQRLTERPVSRSSTRRSNRAIIWGVGIGRCHGVSSPSLARKPLMLFASLASAVSVDGSFCAYGFERRA